MDEYISLNLNGIRRTRVIFPDVSADIFAVIGFFGVNSAEQFRYHFANMARYFIQFILYIINGKYMLLFNYVCGIMKDEIEKTKCPGVRIWIKENMFPTLNLIRCDGYTKQIGTAYEITIDGEIIKMIYKKSKCPGTTRIHVLFDSRKS